MTTIKKVALLLVSLSHNAAFVVVVRWLGAPWAFAVIGGLFLSHVLGKTAWLIAGSLGDQ